MKEEGPAARPRAARLLGGVVAGIGAVALAGWWFDVPRLVTILSDRRPIVPLTAVCLLLLGGAIAWRPRHSTVTAIAGGALVVVGVLVLVEHAASVSFGLDEWLFRDEVLAVGGPDPGRPSPLTALGFVFAGAALAGRGRVPTLVPDVGAVGTLAAGAVATAGYLYELEGFGREDSSASISLPASLALLLAGAALVLAAPERGLAAVARRGPAASLLVRRSMPAVVLVPLVVGAVTLRGELWGWYGSALAIATMAAVASLLGALVVGASAVRVADLEGERAAALAAVEQAKLGLEDLVAERTADLVALEALQRTSLEALDEGVALTDLSGELVLLNPAAVRMLGYEAAELAALLRDGAWEAFHEDGSPMTDDERPATDTLRTQQPVRRRIVQWRHRDGHLITFRTSALPVFDDDGRMSGVVTAFADVTAERAAEARLQHQAFHDGLTALPNRSLVLDRIAHALERGRRAGTTTAVLFIDLDRFKTVNDTLGHEAGDLVLIEVATRLAESVRAEDTVGRLGGDEFLVLAESIEHDHEVVQMATRIIEAVRAPIGLPSGTVRLSTSVGIALDDGTPDGSVHATALLRDADTALYRAKELGRDRYEVFDESMRVAIADRVETEQMLRDALDEGGLVIHFQPIVDLRAGGIVATEALLRVQEVGDGLRPPAAFLDVADESGLIVPMGADVLDRACAQLAAWRSHPGVPAPARVAVNVAGSQLAAPGFVEALTRALEEHRLQPADLVLELTEDTVIGADEVTTEALTALHQLGVSLAVDDFGTGYSSLAYLKRFPIDWVKLDRGFVAGLGEDTRDAEIVRAVVALARSLHLRVVAEGIETAAQLALLRDLGCDCGQGFLLARPAPAEDLADQQAQAEAALRDVVDHHAGGPGGGGSTTTD